MDIGDVASSDDVHGLWRALLAAKADGETDLVAAIEQRMRELGPSRRFGHLSDADLDRQIAGLQSQRAPYVPQGYSPPGDGMSDGIEYTMSMNRAAVEDQHVGLERTLADLHDERARRRGTS